MIACSALTILFTAARWVLDGVGFLVVAFLVLLLAADVWEGWQPPTSWKRPRHAGPPKEPDA